MSGYTGIQTRPTITSTDTVTSLTMNFDNTRIAVGTTGGNGTVSVYDYDINANTWTATGSSLTGPSSGSGFGQSLDMDWSGTRLAVGANTVSQVYVYDYDGANWNYYSNVINSPSGSGGDFGFSVSISKDIADTIAVGAPAHNNVHVYHIVNDAWSEAFSNVGTDIQNIAPIDTSGTNNHVLKPEFNRYGESVRLSSLGDYLIVGQPGTVLSQLDSTNVTGLGTPINVSSLQSNDSDYLAVFGVNQNRQQGSARIFKTENAWYASNAQVGTLLSCEIENTINDASRVDPVLGWSFPGFGMQVDISSDGNFIVVSAPLHSVPGGNYTYHNGQLHTFVYENEEWIRKDTITGLKKVMFGSSVKLDYTGNRISVSGTNKVCSLLNVSDWNGNNWFNAQPDIIQDGDDIHNVTYISNGELALIARDTTTHFYDYLLTQSIIGNNLVSGYLAADELFVGANNNDNGVSSKFSKTKRISFGGTYLDNTYEGATIENRMYKTFAASGGEGNEGRSELYIAKTSEPISVSSSGGVDFIRLKAHEIHLDSYPLINPDGPNLGWNNKYVHSPLFVLNYQKNVGIDLPFLYDVSGTGDFFRGTCNAQAKLDVNGSTYIRNRLNINEDGGNEILGNIGEQPNILWDTRNVSTMVSGGLISNTMVNNQFVNNLSVSAFNYSISEHSIHLKNLGDIVTSGGVSIGSAPNNFSNLPISTDKYIKLSFWFKLTESISGDKKIFMYGNFLFDSGNISIYVTPTGFKIKYKNVYTVVYSYTLLLNTWYHLYTTFPDNRSTGQFNTSLYVNNSALSQASSSGSLSDWTIAEPFKLISVGTLSSSESLSNAYVGMLMFWCSHSDRAPTVEQIYNNGPPTEMLKVGGDAVITGKLGIGVTNPTEALEVSGNVHANYFVGDGSELSNITLQAVTDSGNVTSNTVQFTNTGTSLVTSGKIGLGTTNPTTTLDVNGNAQTNVGYIHRTIVIRDANGGFTDVGPQGTLDLGTLQSGVSFHSYFRSPMIQRGVQGNFIPGDGASWEGNHVIIGFRYVSINTGLTGSTIPFRVYSNNYQTTTFTYYSWTTADDGFERGYMSTTSPPLIQNTGDVPSIWLQNQSTTNTVRINAIWMEYVNI